MIVADDLGYGDVSCQNAGRLVPMPHFHGVAAQGQDAGGAGLELQAE